MVANRGECACRIIRTCKGLGMVVIAVYTANDHASLHTTLASKAVLIPSYLDIHAVIHAAIQNQATSIHPGWGFLSENPDFPRSCKSSGIHFVGPTTDNMMDKIACKQLVGRLGLPTLPGSGFIYTEDEALLEAVHIGYPVILKSANGGGGVGIIACMNDQDVRKNFRKAQTQVESVFHDNIMYLEKFLTHCRHIEVQVFGDGEGNVALLGERECSIQRRYQKIIEEAPAPNLPHNTRHEIFEAAKTMAEAMRYKSVGNMEFIVDAESGNFYFMELNTRLQVFVRISWLFTVKL